MKRLVVFIAAVILGLMLACGKESDTLLGNWKLDLATTLAQLPQDFGVDQVLSFRSDGTFTWTVSADAGIVDQLPVSDTGAGTWKFEDNTLTLSDASGILYVGYVQFSYDKNSITLSGNPPMLFTKM